MKSLICLKDGENGLKSKRGSQDSFSVPHVPVQLWASALPSAKWTPPTLSASQGYGCLYVH